MYWATLLQGRDSSHNDIVRNTEISLRQERKRSAINFTDEDETGPFQCAESSSGIYFVIALLVVVLQTEI